MSVPIVKDNYNPMTDPTAPCLFQYLDEIKPWESVCGLFYGNAGTGKTHFIPTAGPRTLIINIGGGITTILSKKIRDTYYTGGKYPIVATIQEDRDKISGMFKSAEAFDRIKDAIDWALDHFKDRFDTIAIDDTTQLRAFAMNKGLELNKDFNRSKTLEMGRKAEAFIPGIQDYGVEMDLIENFLATTIDFCRDEKLHFILTAHERHTYKPIKDLSGKKIGEEVDKIFPGFTGKTFPDDITKLFDLVWNLQSVRTGSGTVRRAQTDMSMGISAKSRYPGVFSNPETDLNFLNIIKKIKAAA